MADDETLHSALAEIGIDTRASLDSWRDASQLLAGLDAIGRAGSNAIVKVDGGRSGPNVYTVVVSGGRLGEAFFREDGPNLRSLLCDALTFFAKHAGPA